MKILAVDPGTKRVGLAACDEMEITTRLLPVLYTHRASWLDELIGIVTGESFQQVIWGLPLNMDGSEGEAAKHARRMALQVERELKKKNWAGEFTLWDERLTSFAAEEKLKERGIAKAKGKDYLDSLAAQILLEDFLRSR